MSTDFVTDIWGDEWHVEERRTTHYGWDVCLGRPTAGPKKRGGARVIVSPEIAAHLEACRQAPSTAGLPIGMSALKRLRRLLGHNRYLDRAAWWEDHAGDLADLTLARFAAKYGVTVGAAVRARHAFFGRSLRPQGWWRDPAIVEVLMSGRPRSEIADELEISAGAVGRLRWFLRQGKL